MHATKTEKTINVKVIGMINANIIEIYEKQNETQKKKYENSNQIKQKQKKEFYVLRI